ncbi:MAG: hypothetical protein QOJ72_2925 [Nocardioidaceae bacterium]|jgi:hypothetical protein|nr:hypothetical protein [Nocardioidaceae bacterium]
MTTRIHRVILAVLVVTGAVVGVWATGWPQGFYDAFPGFDRHWVSMDGPYNQHLVRDVGAAYLALAVLGSYALRLAMPELVRVAGAAWLVFGGLHFAYHLGHLGMFGTSDKILNVVALGGSVVLAAALLVPARD